MGLFDGLLGKVKGLAGAAELAQHYPALKDALVEQMGKGGGEGLKKMVDGFQGQGLSGLVSSWVGTGQNQNASAQQITQGLSPTVINAIAQKTGLSTDKVSAGLAFVLPHIIDKLTPNGQLPDSSGLKKGLEALQNFKF
jgi:uncharacterized protein YidB (DUF937 family)